jgi:hypothetical protein
MLKIVTTLKKKRGMSTPAFRAYYENTHRLIGEKYLSGHASRYVRRYIEPLPDGQGRSRDPEFDVLLEIWFHSEADFLACSKRLAEPEVAREIAADEEKLFDRSCKQTYLVEEHESLMGGA